MSQLTKTQKYQENQYAFPYHYLDLYVEHYKFLDFLEYLSYLNIVKDLIRPYDGQTILDAGCGDGRFCYEIKNENVKIVGIDFSESAIRFAKAFNPENDFFIQDMKSLNLPNTFDYVVLIETLEHFKPQEIPIITENLSKVLKKDGKLIITTPSIKAQLNKKHYQHFSRESLSEVLKPHFKLIRILGYSRKNWRWHIFFNLKILGYLLYPFRNKLKIIKNFFSFLKYYYEKKLSTGEPENCLGIIAVFKKCK